MRRTVGQTLARQTVDAGRESKAQFEFLAMWVAVHVVAQFMRDSRSGGPAASDGKTS